MAQVRVRNGFSDRNMIKPENKEIQLNNFDERTRTQLMNTINKLYNRIYDYEYGWSNSQYFLQFVLNDIYSEPVDYSGNISQYSVLNMINNTIMNAEYDDVLTLIEAIINYLESFRVNHCNNSVENELYRIVNEVFEREYIGYRFLDSKIVPITDELEIETIKHSLDTSVDGIKEHIVKANRLLSDRNKPDYENSIKESISAVEAMCQIIIGKNGREATLGNMLEKLDENGMNIHPALKEAFKKIYGFTSDAKGIRHAGKIGDEPSTFDEAKFMLVSCCAFINYLKGLSANKLERDL